MTIIAKEIELVGSKGREKVIGLFDSGATYSCIKRELAEKLGVIEILPEPIEFETAKEGENVETKEHMSLIFYLNGYRFSDEFMVLPELSHSLQGMERQRRSERLIIGAKTMQAWRLKLDFEHEDVIIDPGVTRIRLLLLQMMLAKGITPI